MVSITTQQYVVISLAELLYYYIIIVILLLLLLLTKPTRYVLRNADQNGQHKSIISLVHII